MAIHDGVVLLRAVRQLPNRLGKLFGGNFRWELFRKSQSRRSVMAGTGSPGFAKTCAVPSELRSELRPGGIFVWRILIFRHQFPLQPSNRVRIKRAVSSEAGGCKEKCRFLRRAYPLSFRNQSPRELERSPVNKFPTVPRACLSTWCRPRGVR